MPVVRNWYVGVSVPAFLFLGLRWFWRGFVWSRFLARLSRLDLRLVATHQDGAGGIAFVGGGQISEMRMVRTQGATKKDGVWTPDEIAAQIGAILG